MERGFIQSRGSAYLSGVSEKAFEQIVRSDKLSLTGPVQIYEATSVRGESTEEAHADAQNWLVGLNAKDDAGGENYRGNRK